MYKLIIDTVRDIISNIWVKILALIPMCFFEFQERERVAVFALLIIMIIDCVLGAMKASYIDKNFSWNLLAKKFSKKFLLYFLFLGASFILAKAFELVHWWFWVATALIAFSEFGSLAIKSRALGLPIKSDIITALNCRMENYILEILRGRVSTEKEKFQEFEDNKAEKLAEYNIEKAVVVKKGQQERAKKERIFVKEIAEVEKGIVRLKKEDIINK